MTSKIFSPFEVPCIQPQGAIFVRESDDGIQIVQDGHLFQTEDQVILISRANVPLLIEALKDAMDG